MMQPSTSPYSHTQVGWWLIVALGAVVLALAAMLAGFRADVRPIAAPEIRIIFVTVIVVLAITAVMLTTLTVRVTAETVSWHFGAGLIHFSLPLAEITNVAVARTPIWAGIGIHWIFTGWVYNVSGRDAVELTKRDGSKVWIGTDEPAVLHAAIETTRARIHPAALGAVPGTR